MPLPVPLVYTGIEALATGEVPPDAALEEVITLVVGGITMVALLMVLAETTVAFVIVDAGIVVNTEEEAEMVVAGATTVALLMVLDMVTVAFLTVEAEMRVALVAKVLGMVVFM
jgi:hypothetical protein